MICAFEVINYSSTDYSVDEAKNDRSLLLAVSDYMKVVGHDDVGKN